MFGTLTARFRILHIMVCLNDENNTKIILAICMLHNFLRSKVPQMYTLAGTFDSELEGSLTDGSWRACQSQCFQLLPKVSSNNNTRTTQAIRNRLKDQSRASSLAMDMFDVTKDAE